ncbi:MAG TPA: alkaline phosphatase D family protein [Nevskiaceae bacterium]|nr:alkaline phosphatase D family protein [Nevskiaceae bacterium]
MSSSDRRRFLKSAVALGGASGLAGLAGCSNSSPVTLPGLGLPEPADFDYPRVLPLPFAHGVASGDPLADRVIIWTRLTLPEPPAAGIPVRWQLSERADFGSVLREGQQLSVAEHDWTVKVDVTGLAAATTYYYRFEALGVRSLIGRTRTAPDGPVSEVRFAVVSCSSYWSSHWSGYGHIADRNDLDLVLHCGDYIYDFVDEDEEVRARLDRFDINDVDYRDWLDLAELRRRYALFRSDPNLLRAHQQHPWMIVWDNHDIDPDFGNELASPIDPASSRCTLADTVRAFYEWTPTRPPRADGSGAFRFYENGEYPLPEDARLIYRRLAYGPLVDFFGVDTQINLPGYGLSVDASHLPEGAPSLFGRRQFEWLTASLLASQRAGVTWRVVNNQTWIAPVDVPDLAAGIALPKLGISRWTDYSAERAALFGWLRGANPAGERVRGTVFVSGDAHGNLNSDLVESAALLSTYRSGPPAPNPRAGSTPENQAAGMTRASTAGLPGVDPRADSVGVEFAASSLGRGGADEIVANAAPETDSAAQVAATRLIETAVVNGNANVQFIEWVDHGYGIVQLDAEKAIFEHWWQDKLTPGSPDVLGYQSIAWAQADEAALPPRRLDQIDSVTLHGRTVAPTAGSRVSEPAPLDLPLVPR